MIINYDFYYCNKCKKCHSFDTSKEFSKLCPDCNSEMEFQFNADGDTELAEKVKNQKPIIPSTKPTVTCPYCSSTNVHKISTTAKVTNTVLFGIFGTKRHKQFHCNDCKADF